MRPQETQHCTGHSGDLLEVTVVGRPGTPSPRVCRPVAGLNGLRKRSEQEREGTVAAPAVRIQKVLHKTVRGVLVGGVRQGNGKPEHRRRGLA